MKRAIQAIDIILTGLILWGHSTMTFLDLNSIAVWTIPGIKIETSESIRGVTDILIIGILCFHLIDITAGRKLWVTIHGNKLLNFILVGLFVILTFPYLRLWFMYFYYVNNSIDLLRVFFYAGLVPIWILTTIKSDGKFFPPAGSPPRDPAAEYKPQGSFSLMIFV